MCNLVCSIVTTVVGCILVVGSCLISFLLVPDLIDSIIRSEVVLLDDTIQYERFEEVPFPLHFSVTIFEISNPQEVLSGGVPVMIEVGPYVYKLHQVRNITYVDGDIMRYRRIDHFEFDAEASFPYSEDDLVTTINIPYHAIIQIAQESFPQLVSVLNLAMSSVFGEHNSPISTVRVGDMIFDGIRICENPGLLGRVACNIISDIGANAQNLAEQEDGSFLFSLLDYRNGKPSIEHEIHRGLEDTDQLGLLRSLDGNSHFTFWVEQEEGNPGVCNMINGTDSGIFSPFVDREKSIYAINTDICRSVELRYQYDVDLDGIPTAYFSSNEWFLDNNEGCFCLNVTNGINRDDGCLLEGAMELFECVGAMLVLSYPHFLYADVRYRDGVLGMAPNEQNHRIFIDIEPNTGTPIRGAKRAQFNIFQKPIAGIPPTANLRTLLMPIVWVEESIDLPEEYKDELRTRLLRPLNLVDILIPVLIAVCCVVLLVGLACVFRVSRAKKSSQPSRARQTSAPTQVLDTDNKN